MKKILLFLLLLILPIFTYASSDVISNFDMSIYVDKNGNAKVTETWDATANMGTEFYRSYYNYGTSKFADYSVTMDGKKYTYVEDWNLSGSLSDKAYKNGFNYLDTGVEICFGKTSMGKHTYVSKYTISNFILKTKDADVLYWTLMPYNNGGQFKNIHIKIYSDSKYSMDLPVWGYGNGGGTAYVYDGYIEMNSEGVLDNEEYMTLLVKYPLGTFNTTNIDNNNDFNYYYNMAEEGSTDYVDNNNDNSWGVFGGIFQVLFWIFIIFGAKKLSDMSVKLGKYTLDFGKKGRNVNKDAPFFREIPCDKNIYEANFISNAFKISKDKTNLLGAILLKWLKEDKIAIKKVTSKILKIESNAIELKAATFELDFEKDLYEMIQEAAEDGLLEQNEFEKWCKKNYSEILKWFDKAYDYAGANLETKEMLLNIKPRRYSVTDKMFDEANKLSGLRKFLLEFSRINEKQPIEVKLWEEYLMFAQIFGIAKEVAKQFKKLYPELIQNYNYDFDTIIFINMMSHSGMVSATQARAEAYSSGGGGFSSFGGGGGSFGGGGGGGAGGR